MRGFAAAPAGKDQVKLNKKTGELEVTFGVRPPPGRLYAFADLCAEIVQDAQVRWSKEHRREQQARTAQVLQRHVSRQVSSRGSTPVRSLPVVLQTRRGGMRQRLQSEADPWLPSLVQWPGTVFRRTGSVFVTFLLCRRRSVSAQRPASPKRTT